jgi:putative oxidoreductase
MSTGAAAASPAATNPLARFTFRLFGLFPISLTMLVLRVTLALPFWKSGLTKWDGWFTLSFGAKALFTDEF